MRGAVAAACVTLLLPIAAHAAEPTPPTTITPPSSPTPTTRPPRPAGRSLQGMPTGLPGFGLPGEPPSERPATEKPAGDAP